jgi:hypothetical protein
VAQARPRSAGCGRPYSGLGISRFDPVAHFTDGAPFQGKGEFEQSFAGTVWRFRSDENRPAFTAHPKVYRRSIGRASVGTVGLASRAGLRLPAIRGCSLSASGGSISISSYVPETRRKFVNHRELQLLIVARASSKS